MPGRAAFYVLGLGTGALLTTPLCKILAALLAGADWREVLHGDWA